MKPRRIYVCQSCGHHESKWLGRCPACEAWSSLVEEIVNKDVVKGSWVKEEQAKALTLSQIDTVSTARISTGIQEFDRVLGGGLVPGGFILVGGDPGIGKSTLLLQALGALAAQGFATLYVTAEESPLQVKLRAERLGIQTDKLWLLPETQIERVEIIKNEIKPQVLVIDSIQTVGMQELDSAVGSVAQIRGVAQRLMEISKSENLTTFVVGHVTKEGAIAGPKVMEHMVDTVLYFEGEKTGPYRILRAHKNRFGSAQEIGVFEMQSGGLKAVSNPSELFLSQRAQGAGSTIVTSIEGTRPLLLEVQALATPSPFGTPRRTAIGFDPQRVSMLCAVLAARANVDLGAHDIYVNIVGGVRINEPAIDLGVVLALASTFQRRPLPFDSVAIGEVGLSGEIRAVSQTSARIQEAKALGFKQCIVPQIEIDRWQGPKPVLPLKGVRHIEEALNILN